MSKELRNDLSWSVTRAALFSKCQRAYYYTYYGSWDGWNAADGTPKRTLYILKQIKTLPLWTGSIVHDTIKAAMEAFARGEIVFPDAKTLQDAAVDAMRKGWREAVSKEYIKYPKKTNLFELYYGNGKTLPKEQTDDAKARVLECLENFAMSPAVNAIKNTPVVQWKPVDALDSFDLDGLKVWAAPDFAYEDNDGIFHIIDWKTGGEDKESLRLQLACYAMYAMEKWHISLERLRLQGVFLKDGGRSSDYPISPENIIAAKDQILTSAQAMKAKIIDAETNEVDEDSCLCNPNDYRCSICPFRQVCPMIINN